MSVPQPIPLPPDSWQEVLAKTCQELIAEKKQIILCVTGKSGTGKSTLSKQIRKKGLPGIPPRKIAVIDDGVLAVPLFGVFTRRIKRRFQQVRDNLTCFMPYVRKKALVVYSNCRPHLRLERCDVVLRLQLPEEKRKERLVSRNHDGMERFLRTENAPDEVQILTNHVFDLQL